MSKVIVSFLFLLIVRTVNGTGSHRLVAFERGVDVWVANLDGTKVRKIARGSQPNIASGGTRVAFNTDSEDSKELIRHIAVADLTASNVTIFTKQIPSNNCQHAVWSPDGSQIVFNLYTDKEWQLGLIKADGTGFRLLKKVSSSHSLWSACWASDSNSVYVQDLDKIAQLALDGTELKRWNLKTLFPEGGLSSASQMSVSPDGRTLVLEVEFAEEATHPDWDGPPPSVWTLNLGSGKVERVTPKGFFGWGPVWLSNDEILFVSQGAKEKQPSLWRMTRQGESRKQLIKNANFPSVSR